MQTLFNASVQDIAIIETIMRGSGRMALIDDKPDIPLWDIQRDFKSPVFTRSYECNISGASLRIIAAFSSMARITFRYDTLKNEARVDTHKETENHVRNIILDEMCTQIGKIGLNGNDKKVLEMLKQQGEPGGIKATNREKTKLN